MGTKQDIFRGIDPRGEIVRPAVVGVNARHQRSVGLAYRGGTRPGLKPKDLISLILRH